MQWMLETFRSEWIEYYDLASDGDAYQDTNEHQHEGFNTQR